MIRKPWKESKVAVKKDITHNDYVQVLETNEPIKKKARIRSKNHQLYTLTQEKATLTSFYEKQVMID